MCRAYQKQKNPGQQRFDSPARLGDSGDEDTFLTKNGATDTENNLQRSIHITSHPKTKTPIRIKPIVFL